MHEDLRRRALESKKTVSKKKRSRESSLASSLANSRNGSASNSRAPSRQGSDDEDGDYSDENSLSVVSIEGGGDSGEEEQPTIGNWIEELSARISRILDRKRSGVQGREEDLLVYVYILRTHYAHTQIRSYLGDLFAAFLRSIRAETSEREAVLALHAAAISTLTCPSEEGAIYEQCAAPIKNAILDSESMVIKSEAVRTLGAVVFFGGGSTDETDEEMAFLLEVIESNGQHIGAEDNGPVVTAALETWGFLATQLEDMEESSETAMEALVDQLESTDARVQVASGENIALLYEKSYTDVESDEDVSDSDANDVDPDSPDPAMKRRYEPYRRKDQLLEILSSLAKVSGKGLSKKDRKSLHTNFADITQSVENPTRGPRYSSAIDHKTDKHFGSRLKIKLSKNTSMRIDRWWKLHRLRALRKVLQGGFLEHYQNNEVVLETLPVLTTKSA